MTHRKAAKPQREGAGPQGGLRRRDDGGAYRPPRREGGGMASIDDGMAERARDRDLVVDLAGEGHQSDVLCTSVLMLRVA